jgi:hypothetical protein
MTPLNKVLAGALVLLLGLAAFCWLPDDARGSGTTTLVDFGAEAIDHIELYGRMAPDMDSLPEPILLKKVEDSWFLASEGDYPANPERVQPVLDALGEVVVRAPVGTTPGAHAALQVAEDQFTRKITLGAGSESRTLFLGAASGASMQVRPDGADEVYALSGVTAWSIPDTPRRFFDTAYVKANFDEISGFRVKNRQGDHHLVRLGGYWNSEELDDPSAVHQEEVDALSRSLLNVRMSRPVGREVLPEHGLDGSVRVEYTVAEDSATVTKGYTVGSQHGDGLRFVKSDDSDWVALALESTVIRAIETDFKFLEGEPPKETDNKPSGGFFGAP